MAHKVQNGLDLASQRIINLGDPTGTQDATTKAYIDNGFQNSQILTTGESNCDRRLIGNGSTVTSGVIYLQYFTAQKTETINNLITYTSTLAGATPTTCIAGIYSVDGSNNLTLVANIANDTTMWIAVAQYSRSLVSSWSKTKGQRYASAVFVVTAAALPAFVGPLSLNSANGGLISGNAPRMYGQLTGQSGTTLPSTILNSALVSPNPAPRPHYMEFT